MHCLSGINGIGGGSGVWFGLISNLITLLFWGGIIYLGVQLFKKYSGTRVASKTPLDILKERFAKGEISEEEFARMKNQL